MTAQVLARTAGLTRTEWLAVRRQGLGASDAAVITGLSPYRVSAYAVWLDKTGQLDDDEATPRMEWGLKLEDPIAAHFAAEHPELRVQRRRAVLQCVERPWQLCNLDRDIVGRPEHVECKTSGFRRDWAEGVPDHYDIQAQHQMAVTGNERVRFAVLFEGWDYREFVVERDEPTIAALSAVEGRWWQRHVVEGHMPPVDGSAATSDALAARYDIPTPGAEIGLPGWVLTSIDNRQLHATAAAASQAEVDRIDNELKALLGDNEIGAVDGLAVVTWKATKQRARKHGCEDCTHPPDGPPSRRLYYPKPKGDRV